MCAMAWRTSCLCLCFKHKMLAFALKIAKLGNGIVTGPIAYRHLMPEYPNTDAIVHISTTAHNIKCLVGFDLAESRIECYDGDPREEYRLPGLHIINHDYEYRASPMELREITENYADLLQFTIEECYYDADGVFHASDRCHDALKTRTMSVWRARLDRVHHWRSLGFIVKCDEYDTQCIYSPEIHDQILATSSIISIRFKDMDVDDTLLKTFSGRNFSFSRCRITATYCPSDDFHDCTFVGVRVPGSGSSLRRIIGATLSTFAPLSTTLVNGKNDDSVFDPFYEMQDVFCEEQVDMFADFLTGFDGPIPDAHIRQLMSMRRAWHYSPSIAKLLATNKLFAEKANEDTWECVSAHVGPDFWVPSEWIHDLNVLIMLTLKHMTRPKYTFYTNYVRDEDTYLRFLVERNMITSVLYSNYIPTFAHDDAFVSAPLRACHKIKLGCHDCIVIDIDLDGISDMIDRDGYTDETLEFLRDQLEIDHMHDGALARMLRARPDIGSSGLSL